MSDSEDYDDYFNAALFLNENYTNTEYVFNDNITQNLLSSKAASTDHDLTGQVVWPVSILLSWFVAANNHLFRGKNVLEVGAGAGLAGFVASQFAAHTAITDGNDVVLRLLTRNVEHTQANCSIHKLLWGEEDSVVAFTHAFPHHVDIVLGADVVCWPNLVLPLLLSHASVPDMFATVFYCGFVCRATSTRDLLFAQAKAMGFALWTVDHDTFLPTPRPDNVLSVKELFLLGFRLDKTSPAASDPVAFLDDLENLQTAC
ncbi:hypothetical protein SPRG_05905 [Saprolegnia parasitica CBS 223.65]|uniref:Uncharacterized protein n=1 Tax=Saprolegnia parasitica (strain CBS 223.65) TaxID=695850 RepID=A0A067CF36_SAPPC|nr:hypothetical protein SPRG_05905 [Saprolegnia parasitica CBS 223.65]KDO29369.1 hypothetical protein SPRG_05905 [Saprolegnia parasitica CBS 223.65]|eukprot:XP_012199872.1 hypothetical protein SPRG_05905 [Saprolegnia parasitica CBS 223.65]